LTINQACDEYYDAIRRYAKRLTHDDTLADDITQVTFEKALRGWKPEYENWTHVQVSAWFYAIALRAQIDTVRRNGAETRLAAILEQEEEVCGIERVVETRELIAKSLRKLTSHERRLLLLAANGYPYKEIARLTHIADTTVAKRIYIARSAFKEEYVRIVG
jgi:RNA polymerase sigma factor (sigma-70 family)